MFSFESQGRSLEKVEFISSLTIQFHTFNLSSNGSLLLLGINFILNKCVFTSLDYLQLSKAFFALSCTINFAFLPTQVTAALRGLLPVMTEQP
jgi:hypothetical protein